MTNLTITKDTAGDVKRYKVKSNYFLIIFCLLLFSAWIFSVYAPELLSNYGNFFFLGISGAIVANSTGAGGGILFIPAFSALDINSEQALATSILIQCFGMTMGAYRWLTGFSNSKDIDAVAKLALTKSILIYSGCSSIAGMLAGQYYLSMPDISVESIFSYFSLIFGTFLILITISNMFSSKSRLDLPSYDIVAIIITTFIGGVVTSWISIGVGEWLALYLIFRGYPTMIAVGAAVTVSSLAVLAGAPFHITNQNVVWEIVLFAAPAAVIGASVARYVAYKLGATLLKLVFGVWVIATGYMMI